MKRNLLKFGVLATIALLAFSCKKEPIAPTGITITPNLSINVGGSLIPTANLTLKIGQTGWIKATVVPSNATCNVIWNSSDTTIANVNRLGIVTGVGTGRAVIKATTAVGNYTDSCRVTIGNWITYHQFDNLAGAIAIDVQGNKWFGIWSEGVSKFDGNNWTNYNTNNSGLADNFVSAIAIDAQDNKWFATNSGVSIFDGTNWITYTTANSGLNTNFILSIAIDTQGNKWFGTNGNGVLKFDGTNWTNYNMDNTGNSIWSIVIDRQGNLWFAGSSLTKFDGSYWTTYPNSGLIYHFIYSIAFDASGNIWIGTDEGVSEFVNTNLTTYNTANSGLTDNIVRFIAIDASGNKWFETHEGVSKFDGTNWTVYNAKEGLFAFGTNMQSMAIDVKGNIWIGGDVITELYAQN
jgi:ligand-binding sensor domain-containing protein